MSLSVDLLAIPVLMPVLNPGNELVRLVGALAELSIPVIIIDDGSTDSTDVFPLLKGVVVHHPENRGKGAAIKTGFEYVLKYCPHVVGVVTADGDGQHTLEDIVRVRESLKNKPDCLILGSRRFTGVVPLRSRIGNVLTRFAFWLHTQTWLFDTQTGLRGIPRPLLPLLLDLPGRRYDFESEMLVYAINKFPHKEVLIETVYVDENIRSHFRPIIDSLLVYSVFARYCLSSYLAFVLDNLVFSVISWLLSQRVGIDMGVLWAIVVARIVSSNVNYLCNWKAVFKCGASFPCYAKYLIVVFVNTIICFVLIGCLIRLLNVNSVKAITGVKILVECVVFVVSYWLQKRWVFENGD